MTAGLPPAPPAAPSARADTEELVRALVKTLRIRALYEPNNPIYRESSEALVGRFDAYLAGHQLLRLEVREHELSFDGDVVYRDDGTRDSMPFMLHRDGIREITFFEGLEAREIFDFLETVKPEAAREADEEDILSRLWEKDFVHVRYLFVDLFLDEEAIDLPAAGAPAARELGFAPLREEYRVLHLEGEEEVDGQSLLEENRLSEIVKITPDDFDPTLYFLERDEVRQLREEIDREKERNLLLDYLALLQELILLDAASDDAEPFKALAELHAYFFSNGNLGTVVHILDILAELERDARLSPAKHSRAAELTAAAFSPESLSQVGGLLVEEEQEGSEEGASAGYLERAVRFDFGAAVERLGDLKHLAQREELLAPLVTAAAASPETLHRLFRHPDPIVVKNAVFLSGRAANRQSLEALEEPLHSPDAEVRLEAVNALKTYRSARALDLMVEAVSDPDKLVRYYALRNLIAFNYRPALRAVSAAVRERDFAAKDLTEKKLFFEAYGRFGGAEAVPFLRGILGRHSLLRKGESRDLKVCAAVALGEIGGEEARTLLKEHLSERQAEVREACERALARLAR
jgi:HEAT repeat protein